MLSNELLKTVTSVTLSRFKIYNLEFSFQEKDYLFVYLSLFLFLSSKDMSKGKNKVIAQT